MAPEKTYMELGDGFSVPLSRRATSSSRPVSTMAEWNLLFGRAISGYCLFNLGMLQPLLKHHEWMNKAAYLDRFQVEMLLVHDEELRKQSQGPRATFEHDLSLMDMYLMGPGKKGTKRGARKAGTGTSPKKKVRQCYKWECGDECPYTDCKFRHACRHCGSEVHRPSECKG